ncbi:sulfur carrier protein ThiS [Actinomadura viridis]|uniref:Sulfur carrier protein n=1 Tax=Actinomadura viridis TaxID=58110 RepID=A0A931GQA2_9ACTN|nr:sulfur carrier protein ThiS [Actinomadura viridis]MBG6088294.1 sulfur carrier protein [Actinomadura viridis]
MKVIINGRPHELPEGASVADAVGGVTGPAGLAGPGPAGPGAVPGGVAAALNDEVVRRSEWAATTLKEADRLEVLTAVQGG